jgi:transposase
MNEIENEIWENAPAVLKLSDRAIAMSLSNLKAYMSARKNAGCEFDYVIQQIIDAMEKVGFTYFHASGPNVTIQSLLDIMNDDSLRKNLDSAEPIDLDKLFALGEEPLDDKNE